MLLDKSPIYKDRYFSFKYGSWYYNDENIPAICALILFISGAGAWILIDHIYDIAYLLSAPKLYLIEAFADLFK